ncbi:MAG: c-type cytochrome [Bacteroidia bacterium]
MKEKYLTVLFIISMIFTISATSYKPNAPDGFKNLKVLPKDISKEKLDSVMDHFAVSLGVKCSFCHAANADTTNRHLDFASDKKEEKNIARKMFQMTAYLNANYFNEEHSDQPDTIHAIVCYTCHHGTKEPDSKVFLALIDSTLQVKKKGR